jgi:hypothetical protein
LIFNDNLLLVAKVNGRLPLRERQFFVRFERCVKPGKMRKIQLNLAKSFVKMPRFCCANATFGLESDNRPGAIAGVQAPSRF